MSPLEDQLGLVSSFEDMTAASRAPNDILAQWKIGTTRPEPTISHVRRRLAASRTPRIPTMSQEYQN